MKMKTIAFVIPSLSSGGAERVVSTLGNELVKDFNVVIINFDKNKPFYQLDDRIKLRYCSAKIEPSKNIWESLKLNYGLYKRISAIFKIENVDLGIGFMTTANVITILAAKANNIPVIISERIDPVHAKTPLAWKHIKKWVYPKTDYLIIQTEQIKKFFVTKMSQAKLVILPNPLSNELSPNNSGSSQRKNIILNVGRLSDQKGQDILIKAFSNLNPSQWELVIVGEGPNREAYQKLISGFGMEEKISLVGLSQNISEYYNSAKIFAFTSHFEGFPNALIEAMFMGLACISTDCPTGPSELISNGENGFLIDVNDEKTLAEKLSILMKDPKLIESYSNAAQKSVQKFKAENVSKEWKRIISLAMVN